MGIWFLIDEPQHICETRDTLHIWKIKLDELLKQWQTNEWSKLQHRDLTVLRFINGD